MSTPQEEIRALLEETERKYNLKDGTLTSIYADEARVVFMGRRRDLFKRLREIISQAAPELELNSHDDSLN